MSTALKFLFGFTLFASLFLTAACNKDDDNGGNNNSSADIIPGVGLKDVKIGDPAQKAFDAFGTVPDSYVEFGGQYFHFLIYISKGITINLEPTNSETLDPNTKIQNITVSDPYAGKTDKNIGIGSTKTEVRAAYGQPDLNDPNADAYAAIGISFGYDDQEKVETITIAK